MSGRALALVVALVAAAALAAGARADGDPASDYLISQQVYLPSDANVPVVQQRELVSAVASANEGGYPLKVALIWDSYDLGLVPELFGKPEPYARFLDTEDEYWFKTKTHLLVVMPAGFGFAQWKRNPAAGYRAISRIPIQRTPAGLATAAVAAVVKLAAAHGVTVKVSSAAPAGSNQNAQDRIEIVVAVAAALLLGLAARFLIRRRAARSAPR